MHHSITHAFPKMLNLQSRKQSNLSFAVFVAQTMHFFCSSIWWTIGIIINQNAKIFVFASYSDRVLVFYLCKKRCSSNPMKFSCYWGIEKDTSQDTMSKRSSTIDLTLSDDDDKSSYKKPNAAAATGSKNTSSGVTLSGWTTTKKPKTTTTTVSTSLAAKNPPPQKVKIQFDYIKVCVKLNSYHSIHSFCAIC